MTLSKIIASTTASLLSDLQILLAEFNGFLPEYAARGLISLTPTRHIIELASGSRLYTYCPLDTLLIPRLLGEDAQLSSRPPHAQEALLYTIVGGKLQAATEWVLSFPQIRMGDKGEFKGSFCPYVNAFADAKAYRAWAEQETVATHPLSFAEADALAREYAAQLDAAAPKVCGCGCGV